MCGAHHMYLQALADLAEPHQLDLPAQRVQSDFAQPAGLAVGRAGQQLVLRWQVNPFRWGFWEQFGGSPAGTPGSRTVAQMPSP